MSNHTAEEAAVAKNTNGQPPADRFVFMDRAQALSDTFLPYVGTLLGLAWERRSEWISRRVDSYEFHDSESSQCHSSFDFTIPSRVPRLDIPEDGFYCVVPLMYSSKKNPSINFDAKDASGDSICRLCTQESAKIGGEILISFAEAAIKRDLDRDPRQRCADLLPERLIEIASLEPHDWDEAPWEALAKGDWHLSKVERERLFSGATDLSMTFKNAVECLARSFLLCVLIRGVPGQLKIVNLSFDQENTWKHAVLARLGWTDWLWTLDDVPAQDPSAYHMEISVPEGIHINEVTEVTPDPGDELKIQKKVMKEKAHVVVDDYPPAKPLSLNVSLRVARGSWLGKALFAGIWVAVLSFLVAALADSIEKKDTTGQSGSDHIFLAGTLFLAVGAGLIALLSGNEENELRAKMLRYLRVLLAFQVGLAFAAVMVFVVIRNSTKDDAIAPYFYWIGGLAAAASLAVGYAWARRPWKRPAASGAKSHPRRILQSYRLRREEHHGSDQRHRAHP